jgi:hypothetical protein
VNIQSLLQSCLKAFRESRSEEESMAILKRLREGIRAATNEEAAAAALIAFLQSGEDAATGLPFLVGADGMMELVPSMRTALLDLLPSLDPLASIDMARQVIDTHTSQDEYALGLRNLAWNNFEGDMNAELAGRLSDMLNTNEWLAAPSPGFLEAFDIAVELGDGRAFDDMASILRLESTDGQPVNNGVTRASFMALDRIALRNPALLAEKFAANPEFLSHAPEHRAALMSRLDITDPVQRDAFTSYLNQPGVTQGELEYFSELFPNGNYFYGNRLVTADEATPSLVERQEMDRQTLAQVDGILPAMGSGPGRDALQKIRGRLVEYTQAPANAAPAAATPAVAPPDQGATPSTRPPDGNK